MQKWIAVYLPDFPAGNPFDKFRAYCHLLSVVNKKGEVHRTRKELSVQWQVSKSTVGRYLEYYMDKSLIQVEEGVITILEYDTYPQVGNIPLPRKRVKTRLFVNELSLDIKKMKIPEERLATYIFRKLYEAHPDHRPLKKAKMSTWLRQSKLLLNDRSGEEIVEVLDFAIGNYRFWRKTILSVAGFHRNYDKIKIEMTHDPKKEIITVQKKQEWKEEDNRPILRK